MNVKNSSLYLDHNASTPLAPEVLAEMKPWLEGDGANASSVHVSGRKARHAIDFARAQVAKALHCAEDEVIFTGSGTEANNLAILGAMRASKQKHFITDNAEHSSVMGPAKQLEKEGYAVERVSVNSECRLESEKILAAVRPETGLVSLMLANNEIGSIQPIKEIAGALKNSSLIHCDAVQAIGKIPVDFEALDVDLLSISAHKFYGPPGVGALICKKGTRLEPLLFGGGQEHELRAGSEDVPAIVGMGKAIELAMNNRNEYSKTFSALTQKFRELLLKKIEGVQINTPEKEVLANTVNVSFPKMDGRSLLIQLDLEGIAASLGSACASGSILPSHVLLAMGKNREQVLSSLRFSFGWGNRTQDLDRIVDFIEKTLRNPPSFRREK